MRTNNIKTSAVIAWEPNQPFEFEEIDLEGPKDGEFLIRIVTTSLCHTDVFTLSSEDPEGLFSCILGHEGCDVVEEVGKGVTSVKPGDHVIPIYVPEDPECSYIKSGKTNLCQTIGARTVQVSCRTAGRVSLTRTSRSFTS